MQEINAIPVINLHHYHYHLPEGRIAQYPLAARDSSKLLLYSDGHIQHHTFKDLPGLLPAQSLLCFNDTKVIPARLLFRKPAGALIEVFLLYPVAPFAEVQQAMQAERSVQWRCLIGNKKRWKSSLTHALTIKGTEVLLQVHLADSEAQEVRFEWEGAYGFAEILAAIGELPLPPYIVRKAENQDEQRYQTVYSAKQGAVAAPTAGLHFTEEVLQNLHEKGIERCFLTLHVGAGTFQPVKEKENVQQHAMHQEQMLFSKESIAQLLEYAEKPIIAVGTTSMRSLESLYWFGVLLKKEGIEKKRAFFIEKLQAYTASPSEQIPLREALELILAYLQVHQLKQLQGSTEILIMPGYTFKACKGLVTNFHMPETTLILLIAAFVGEDWRNIYEEALVQGYRFLSYGDSSLLLPQKR
ncbi:MAG: S-adenosylmethionine:tRNA ribosyltransferase-isomerase [Saprospiraceae bacterium]|nr:S-adenosylmethionine:tRNA ribosyltransferase-isomerase [Saprospiraceae bacterium]